jgi:hypothetical protein
MSLLAKTCLPEAKSHLALMGAGFMKEFKVELSPEHFLAYVVPRIPLPLDAGFDCATEYKQDWESGADSAKAKVR